MHPKRVPGSAADWMIRAKSDLAIANPPLPQGALYEDLCFHAQQAAEKALKAIYQHNEFAFNYTHDLNELMIGLKQKGIHLPEQVLEADILTRFAWESRYPNLGEPVTEEEYREALHQAQMVVTWAEKMIESTMET